MIMDPRNTAREALRDSVKCWSDFVSKCLTKRLDAGPFEDYVKLIFARHPLTPEVIADFLLQPQASNCVSPDPRIPPYISVLTQLRYIDAVSILRSLYRYSSLHTQTPLQAQGQDHDQDRDQDHQQEEREREKEKEREKDGEEEGKDATAKEHGHEKTLPGDTKHEAQQDTLRPSRTRWKSSSWLEEVMFYHVIRLVVEGTASKDSRTALELIHVTSKWMSLFAAASNSMAAEMLSGTLQDPQVRHDMEVSRAAFVPLLLRLVDNPALVKVISHPSAKGMRPVTAIFCIINCFPHACHMLTIVISTTERIFRQPYILCACFPACPPVRGEARNVQNGSPSPSGPGRKEQPSCQCHG